MIAVLLVDWGKQSFTSYFDTKSLKSKPVKNSLLTLLNYTKIRLKEPLIAVG
jgi:hypothetical protein